MGVLKQKSPFVDFVVLKKALVIICLIFGPMIVEAHHPDRYSPCPAEQVAEGAIWCEEFEELRDPVKSRPNPCFWDYDIGGGGWGNEEFQEYVEGNAVVENGILQVKVERNETDGSYTSARITTRDKVWFQYGTMSAKVRIPNLEGGLWPAYWLLGANYREIIWPECGEIDIAEWGFFNAFAADELHYRVSSTFHWQVNGSHVQYGQNIRTDARMDIQWHVYTVDWNPQGIWMYVDSKLVVVMDIQLIEAFQLPHFLILNVAVGGSFTGLEYPFAKGGEMLEVDWIRVYDNGFTNVTVANCGDDFHGSAPRSSPDAASSSERKEGFFQLQPSIFPAFLALVFLVLG